MQNLVSLSYHELATHHENLYLTVGHFSACYHGSRLSHAGAEREK